MTVKKYVIILILFLMASAPAMAKDPYEAPNNSWISLSGTVVTAGKASFELDYGQGIVTIEMDDWDWYRENYLFLPGDMVTVYGYVDDDLFENTSIEASSVYVSNLNTFYYADDDDEEDMLTTTAYRNSLDNALQLRGTITGIDGRRFTIDIGQRKMKVNTIAMFYNPLDDKGYQKLKVGDYVQVTGKINSNVFKKAELVADSVTTLVKDKTKKRRDSQGQKSP
ncbi:MAG: DUF5666 domain-containing protein [Desulforhopalus sp.]